jgi:hypothetical protein
MKTNDETGNPKDKATRFLIPLGVLVLWIILPSVGAAPPGRQDLNGRCLRAEFGPDTLRAANRLKDGQWDCHPKRAFGRQTYASEVIERHGPLMSLTKTIA